MFKKRKRPPSSILPFGRITTPSGEPPLGYLIEFDMMLKGNVYERPGGKVRQYGVTVNGGTKLVTSGDSVDRATYEALIDVGVLRPDPAASVDSQDPEPTINDENLSPVEPPSSQDD